MQFKGLQAIASLFCLDFMQYLMHKWPIGIQAGSADRRLSARLTHTTKPSPTSAHVPGTL